MDLQTLFDNNDQIKKVVSERSYSRILARIIFKDNSFVDVSKQIGVFDFYIDSVQGNLGAHAINYVVGKPFKG